MSRVAGLSRHHHLSLIFGRALAGHLVALGGLPGAHAQLKSFLHLPAALGTSSVFGSFALGLASATNKIRLSQPFSQAPSREHSREGHLHLPQEAPLQGPVSHDLLAPKGPGRQSAVGHAHGAPRQAEPGRGEAAAPGAPRRPPATEPSRSAGQALAEGQQGGAGTVLLPHGFGRWEDDIQ